ncbi:class I SAM-dependent methyltransferase [Cohnella caldifontis]|uniref:class I SAM-dependent methyltransferase n=1 Tax=Cohnella caldifontis TaxID=3027471 RepID=UPI0023EB686D|nr:methyltransferase domain-containing protein [Cohnella sp. YIM B05605]
MRNEQRVHWAAGDYDRTMGFVSRYGQDLLEWLEPRPGERILDFGCGTGDLAAKIAGSGADVEGVDISPEMAERARSKYPSLKFHCADGTKWRPDRPFHSVFSNAALHWIKDAEGAARTIADCLLPGGKLAAEFGGAGNVRSIVDANFTMLTERGLESGFALPWYFPSIGEYASLLEKNGFEVLIAMMVDRPTALEGEEGMLNWLRMFGEGLVPETERAASEAWLRELSERLRPKCYRNGAWQADYRRLRVLAVRKA